MSWENLSLREKAAYIRTGVKNGIKDINGIKEAYNEFAMGGFAEQEDPPLKGSRKTLEDLPRDTYEHWRASLPKNLQDDTMYNLKGAYENGDTPTLEDDALYHLHTRDPKTGEILKKPMHPTFLRGLLEDARMGYYPYTKDGKIYTDTWEGNKHANGGNLFKRGGPEDIVINRTYTPSDNIQDKIAEWEGASMATNRDFKKEAADFNRVLSPYIKERASQEALDAMFSQSYNTGYNRWSENVQPHIENFYKGEESLTDIFNTVTVHPKDFKESHRGFRGRRYKEYNEIAKHPYVNNTRVINDNNEYGRVFSINDDGSTWVRNDDGRVYKSEYLTLPELTVTARRKKK